ncbi:MAG: lamin tail domain-containing protein, partial [Elusimicrobiota bacterium]
MAPNTLYRFDDSIYIELPGADGILNTPIGGTRVGDDISVLIDGGGLATGGPLMELMLAKIGASGTLHYVVETHPHGDHNAGLAGDLDGTYTIGSVYKSGSTIGSQVSIAAGALYNPVRGDVLSGPGTNLGPGWDPNVSAKVLWIANADPWGETNPNNISMVIHLRYGKSTFLFGGDATAGNSGALAKVDAELLKYYSEMLEGTDIYKLHHHGSKHSNSPELLAVLKPKYGITPAPRRGDWHPYQEVLERIRVAGGINYRVDLDWNVTVVADKEGNYAVYRDNVYGSGGNNPTYTATNVVGDTEKPNAYPPPSPPKNLAGTPQDYDKIAMDWTANFSTENVNGYDVFWATGTGGDSTAGGKSLWAAPPPTTSGIYKYVTRVSSTPGYTVANLDPGTTYYYRITAKTSNTDERRWGNEVKAITNGIRPASVKITEISADGPGGSKDQYVEIYNPTGNSIDISNYKLEYKIASGGAWGQISAVPAGTTLYAKKYYLIAHSSKPLNGTYTAPASGATPDLTWGTDVDVPLTGGNFRILNAVSTEIDRVAWGNGDTPEGSVYPRTIPSWGSIYRKSWLMTNQDQNNNSVDFDFSTSTSPPTPQSLRSPKQPQGLIGAAGNGSAVLDWTQNADESSLMGYVVYRSTRSNMLFKEISRTKTNSYGDTGLTNGVTYYYRVTAYDTDYDESRFSDYAQLLPTDAGDVTPPATVSLSATDGYFNGAVLLNFAAPGDDGNKGRAAYYIVRWTNVAINTQALFNSATDYPNNWMPMPAGINEQLYVARLTPGATFFFNVIAVDDSGNKSTISNSPSAPAGRWQPVAGSTVVISQVAQSGMGWVKGAGKVAADADDFVELYNPTNADIDISGWNIQYKSATGAWADNIPTYGNTTGLPAGSTIKAYSYFLIAWTTDYAYGTDLPAQAYGAGMGGTGGGYGDDGTFTSPDYVRLIAQPYSFSTSGGGLRPRSSGAGPIYYDIVCWDDGTRGTTEAETKPALVPPAMEAYANERKPGEAMPGFGHRHDTNNNLNDVYIKRRSPRNTKYPAQSPDTTPPGAIQDLLYTSSNTAGKLSLGWTAVSDDGYTAGATVSSRCVSYLVKYATYQITTEAHFKNAASYLQFWAPKFVGQTEQYLLEGFQPGTTYYFAIKAVDEKGYVGGMPTNLPVGGPAGRTVWWLLISEITTSGFNFDGSGKGSNNEYIELMNVTNNNLFLNGLKLNYRTAAPPTVLFSISLPDITLSPGQRYLIGNTYSDADLGNGYVEPFCGPTPDMTYSNVEGTNDYGGHWELVNAANKTIDLIGWGNASAPEGIAAPTMSKKSLQSIERKPLGSNSLDTNNNGTDFEITTLRNPQSIAAPARVQNLNATGRNAKVELMWTDNTEPDLVGYRLYRSTYYEGPYTWIQTISKVNNTYTDTAVTNNVGYYYGMCAYDSEAPVKLGQISNIAFAMPYVSDDVIPPGKINTISGIPGADIAQIRLFWKAPGDDDYSVDLDVYPNCGYVLKYATFPISTEVLFNHVSASTYTQTWSPAQVNQQEDKTLSDVAYGGGGYFTPGTTYYFAIKAYDEKPNYATLSNCATVYAQTQTDFTAPAKIANLAGSPGTGSGEVNLTWTAVGDDGNSGTAKSYVLKYALSAIDTDTKFNNASAYSQTWSPLPSGQTENKTLVNMSPGTTYYFAIKAGDDAHPTTPNYGPLSNCATTYAGMDSILPGMVNTLTALPGSDTGSIQLSWIAVGDDGNTGTAQKYLVHYSTTSNILSESAFNAADTHGQLWTTASAGTAESKVIQNLMPGVIYYWAIRAVDEADNRSPIWTNANTNWTAATSASNTLYFRDGLPEEPAPDTTQSSGYTDTSSWARRTMAVSQGSTIITVGNNVVATKIALRSFVSPALAAQAMPSGTWTIYSWGDEPYTTSNSNHQAEVYIWSPGDTYDISVGISAASAELGTAAAERSYTIAAGAAGAITEGSKIVLEIWTDADYTNAVNQNFYYNEATRNSRVILPWAPSWPGAGGDTTPPAAVADLSAIRGGSEGTIAISWTAPGDDGNSGLAAAYLLKYATYNITSNTLFNQAGEWSQTWTPLAAGQTESKTIGPLTPGVTYYLSIKTRDEVPNWSVRSNTVFSPAKEGSAPPPGDTTAPSAVTNLSALTGATGGEVRLSWTSPGDDGMSGNLPSGGQYKIQHSTWTGVTWSYNSAQVTISTSNVAPGAKQTYVIGGLTSGATYYFRLWTADEVPNWSGISNGATTYAQVDIVAPSAITNLSALTGAVEGEVRLSWTSPGDDGMSGNIDGGWFKVRYATYSVDWAGAGWGDYQNKYEINIPTSTTPSASQWRILTGLRGGVTYYIRVWAADEVPNWSGISNGATTYAQMDMTAPSAITSLGGTQGTVEGEVRLSWTSPGDDGMSGNIDGGWFKVRYATYSVDWAGAGWGDYQNKYEINIPTSTTPSQSQWRILTGLRSGVTYYIRVWAADEVPNWSGISNGATTYAQTDKIAPSAITNLSALTGAVEGNINLAWTSPGDDGMSGNIDGGWFKVRYATYSVDWAGAGWGDYQNKYEINIPTSTTPSQSQWRVLTGLRNGVTYYIRVWAADEA